MDDNRIEIVAGLDIPKTKSTIKDELDREVNPYLSQSQALKITCHIDTSNIAGLQKQLSDLSKGLKLNVGSSTVNLIDDKAIKNQAKALSDALDLAIPRGKTSEIREEIQRLVDEYKKAFQTNDYNAITKSFENLEAYVGQFRKEVVDVNQELLETQQYIKELARQGKTFINESDFNELKHLLDGGKNASAVLSKAFGVGNWTKDIDKATRSWDQLVQELNDVFDTSRVNKLVDIDSGHFNDHIDGVIQLVDYLNKSFDQGDDIVKEYGEEIRKQFGDQLYTELNKILGISNSLEEEWTEIFNPNEVKEATQEVQKLGNTLKTLPNIGVGADSRSTLEGAKSTLNDFFNAEKIDGEATRVKRAVEDTTGELQRFYVQVERGDKSVETLTYALNEQGDAYEYLGKVIREADNSTDFRRRGLDVQKQLQTENLTKFVAQVERSGVATDELNKRIESLQGRIEKIDDTSSMNAFLDDLDIAKAQFQALNNVARTQNFAETLSNKIKKLSADMDAYAVANKRAIDSTKLMSDGTSFSAKWNDLTSRMAKGTALSASEVKHLGEEFRIFGKEAEAAGLKGDSAWQKFVNSFKVMSSYVTANMVFNFVKRSLRDMVQEVTAVDTAMTELRKVTEATNSEFEAFAISAGKTGRELGASVSDVINATATFARLGESLPDAEELGKVATLYKNVGDGIDIETASEDIISAMKAFKVETKDAITLVDKFNEVGNSFAISSGGIGEALKRSASALAAANNDISESIALITTANTIAQDPTTVGQGIKTVSLRLRSTKTQLEELGEDAEGAAENVSKLRNQMLALTGVDIQFDDSTYKSTYQILLEISKVWGRLDDLSRSSVLEQLFGKRQANIGAAILENGELLEKVYKTSEGSMGSAMREQEEYAKSIQYSIDTLKAAYQDFADSVINSDFVKNLLGTAQSFLEVLTKIIDKFGTLPTLLTGLAAVGGIKGVGKLTEYAYLRSVA